jgi:uracil-DNA glycosylase
VVIIDHGEEPYVNIEDSLANVARENQLDPASLRLPECSIDVDKIAVVMIGEVPPQNPDDGFYSDRADSDYMVSTLRLFARAGVEAASIQDLIDLGIYIPTAVKTPKTEYTVSTETIKAHLPILKAELDLFPNLKVIMLMGDVAKKAVNMIAKAETKKNAIPSGSTYKIRQNEYFWKGMRVFPSYIMTGGNILIEKAKCEMIADDIRRMMKVIRN